MPDPNDAAERGNDERSEHDEPGRERARGRREEAGARARDARPGDAPSGERKRPGKKPLVVLAIIVVLLLVGAFVWWFATRNQVSTDDAYTDGNAITIAPKVSGYVVALAIDDNVYVHRGDLLLVIDQRDYQAQVDAARAQLGLAQAQLDAAQASFRQALAAYERQHAVDARATSQQAIDVADAQRLTADANVATARAQARTASLVPQQIRQAQTAVEQRRQQVLQAQAQLEAAQLALSYCEVRAPSDGWITRRNVQLGSFLQAGAALFAIVTPQLWVTANFKESQLERMRAGDRVSVSVDAYPNLELHGHVDSIQLGSGSRFSAFPPENATGNFVKIVQRVPVKIAIDGGLPRDPPLGIGLSVVPKVYLK
ncbi:multidrug export protein EmrA [Burkholderia pseudomallei]|uniref:HlyD family secretion protein n=1 Tax=Burkholderia pseudomallei TaxID=28450 RepID=UPI000A1A23C9|nr:HlyD family secretion protein [Burkholderia pseudomallei]ARK55285.1 multidrug export protein EmrA [Burkholderia pseudomallei]